MAGRCGGAGIPGGALRSPSGACLPASWFCLSFGERVVSGGAELSAHVVLPCAITGPGPQSRAQGTAREPPSSRPVGRAVRVWWERDREGRPGMGEGWRGALADPTAGGRSTRLRTQAALWLARQLGEKCGHRAEGGGEAGGRGAGVVPKATLAPGATVVWTSFLSLQGLQAFWVPGWLLLRDQPFPCEQGGLSLGKSPS